MTSILRISEIKEILRKKRIKRKKKDAFLKKGLAKNFQPLRAKRAQLQTTDNNSKDYRLAVFFLEENSAQKL